MSGLLAIGAAIALGIGFGIGCTVQSVGGFRYAVAAAGVPGHLVVDHCRTTGAGKNRDTVCSGTFTSLDARTVDPHGSIDSSHPVGVSLRVQDDLSTGHCYRIGVEPAAVWVAEFFGGVAAWLIGLAALGFLCLVVLEFPRERLRRRYERRWIELGSAGSSRGRVSSRFQALVEGRRLRPGGIDPTGGTTLRLMRRWLWTLGGAVGAAALSGIVAGIAAIVS